MMQRWLNVAEVTVAAVSGVDVARGDKWKKMAGVDGRPLQWLKHSQSSSLEPCCAAHPLSTAEENSSLKQRHRNSHPLCQYLPAGLKSNTLILKVFTLCEATEREGRLEKGGALWRRSARKVSRYFYPRCVPVLALWIVLKNDDKACMIDRRN